MRQLLKLLAMLCAVLFILTAVFVLLLFNIERKAFSSATYKQSFEEQRLYERMPGLMASALQESIAQNPGAFPFLKELSAEDWQSTISTVLPPEEMRALADSALDSTFDYINGMTNSVAISLLPIKAQLSGPQGVTIIRQFLQTQPPCTIDQLTQMGLGFLGGNIALCNPPEEAMGLVEPLIQSQLQTIDSAFPNEVTLVPETPSGGPSDPRYPLHVLRSAIHFSPFFVILLLLAIALFAVRSLRDLLIWWGWPFLIAGLGTALIAFVGSPIVGWFLQFFIETQAAVFLPSALVSSIAATGSAVASQILLPVAIQGFVLAALGIFMVVVGSILARRQRDIFTTPFS